MVTTMHPYDCVYIDKQQRGAFCTYARDSYHAQQTYNEMVGDHGLRLVHCQARRKLRLVNKTTLSIELETYSDSPEEWVADLIVDALEEGETISSITSTSHTD